MRRMLESVGHAVSRLIRIRYGAMVLPRGLKRGAWMELDESDIRALMHAAGGAGKDASTSGSNRNEDGAARPPQGRNKRRGQRSGGPRGAGGAPRSPGTGNGGRNFSGGPASGGGRADKASDRGAAGGQPDPMKTAFGYIGADSFSRQRQESGQRGRNSSNGQRRGGRPK